MPTLLKKRLTPTEKGRHWIRLPQKIRNLFPPDNVEFKIKVGKNTTMTRVDNQHRLFLGSIVVGDLDLDSPNAIIVIEMGPQGEYIIRKHNDI